jgi:hypothetical protein
VVAAQTACHNAAVLAKDDIRLMRKSEKGKEQNKT